MKRCLFAFFLGVGTFNGLSQAQPLKTKLPVQRILYVRHMPSAVSSRLPRKSKSRFFGRFKLAATKPLIFVHLYNSATAKKGFAIQQSFTIDMFEIQRKNNVGKAGYRLLQSFPLEYKGWGWAPEKFGAQLLWLDPKQHRQPIIKFDCISSGDYGPSGDHVLLTFARGLEARPVIQNFHFGSWRASDTSGESNSFDDVDEKGLLQVSQQIYLATGEIPTPPPVIWKWNGKAFEVPTPPSAIWKWNGKSFEPIIKKP